MIQYNRIYTDAQGNVVAVCAQSEPITFDPLEQRDENGENIPIDAHDIEIELDIEVADAHRVREHATFEPGKGVKINSDALPGFKRFVPFGEAFPGRGKPVT